MTKLTTNSPNALFMPPDANKDVRSSIGHFIRWLDANRVHWLNADIKDYRAYLMSDARGLAKASAKKHMERVRARYKELLHHNGVRDMLRDYYLQHPPESEVRLLYSLWEFTAETLVRLENNTQYNPSVAIKLPQQTVRTDDKFTWLTRDEIDALFARIPSTQIGMRDAAIFGLCLSYGLRESEVCKVRVEDMRKFVNSKAGVEITLGKGGKQRFVHDDPLTDYTGYISAWIETEGITSGLVLKGLGARQLQNRVKVYTDVAPHDLRRTYAKLLHTGGRSIEYIAQQLGHAKLETTLIYLGMITS